MFSSRTRCLFFSILLLSFEIEMTIDGSIVTSPHRIIPLNADPQAFMAFNLRKANKLKFKEMNRKSSDDDDSLVPCTRLFQNPARRECERAIGCFDLLDQP